MAHHRRLCAVSSPGRRCSRSPPNHPLIPGDQLHQQPHIASSAAPALLIGLDRLKRCSSGSGSTAEEEEEEEETLRCGCFGGHRSFSPVFSSPDAELRRRALTSQHFCSFCPPPPLLQVKITSALVCGLVSVFSSRGVSRERCCTAERRSHPCDALPARCPRVCVAANTSSESFPNPTLYFLFICVNRGDKR